MKEGRTESSTVESALIPASELDLLEEIAGGTSLVISPTSRPRGAARITRGRVGELDISLIDLDFPALAFCARPDDTVTVGLTTVGAVEFDGWPARPNRVFAYGSASEARSRTSTPSRTAVVTMGAAVLERVLGDVGAGVEPPREGSAWHLDVPPATASQLERVLRAATLDPFDPARAHADEILDSLVVAFSDYYEPVSAVRSASTIVSAALDLIDAHPGRRVRIDELCVVGHVSYPTLRRAFHKVTGVGPYRFMHLWALHRVRHDLRGAAPGVTVADVARANGFTHLGRFSAAFRARYDETPSRMLRRGQLIESG